MEEEWRKKMAELDEEKRRREHESEVNALTRQRAEMQEQLRQKMAELEREKQHVEEEKRHQKEQEEQEKLTRQQAKIVEEWRIKMDELEAEKRRRTQHEEWNRRLAALEEEKQRREEAEIAKKREEEFRRKLAELAPKTTQQKVLPIPSPRVSAEGAQFLALPQLPAPAESDLRSITFDASTAVGKAIRKWKEIDPQVANWLNNFKEMLNRLGNDADKYHPRKQPRMK